MNDPNCCRPSLGEAYTRKKRAFAVVRLPRRSVIEATRKGGKKRERERKRARARDVARERERDGWAKTDERIDATNRWASGRTIDRSAVARKRKLARATENRGNATEGACGNRASPPPPSRPRALNGTSPSDG